MRLDNPPISEPKSFSIVSLESSPRRFLTILITSLSRGQVDRKLCDCVSKICNKKCKFPNRASVRSSSNTVYSRYEYRPLGKTLIVGG